MEAGYLKKSRIAAVVYGACYVTALGWGFSEAGSSHTPSLVPAALIWSGILALGFAIWYLIKAKHRSRAWIACVVLNFVGLIIVVALADKSDDAQRQPQ